MPDVEITINGNKFRVGGGDATEKGIHELLKEFLSAVKPPAQTDTEARAARMAATLDQNNADLADAGRRASVE